MSRKEAILIVDDDEAVRRQLLWGLRDDHDVYEAGDREGALAVMRDHAVDAVLLDLRLPPRLDDISGGKQILEELRRRHSTVPVIIMTGDQDRQTAVEMVALGALDLFRKPVDLGELRVIVKRALRLRGLEREVRILRSHLATTFGIEGLIGRSPAMNRTVRLIRKVADTDATVLIRGESGTGKELVARALHQLGSRREAVFVALNCSAVPSNLIDDELFGHERGAFTGAAGRRQGKFEFASGGTLFLDEAGDLPLPVQTKLLRVLQESEIQRIGGNETIPVDVRVLAATHQDLERRCDDGSFRQDLYYRLNVVTIAVPPLREREGDVALLAEHFLKKHATPTSPASFAPAAIEALRLAPWPGNVRQLENLVHALCVTCEGTTIEPDDLPPELRRGTAGEVIAGRSEPPVELDLASTERAMIRSALARTGGNRTHAARLLGISRHVLLGKLKRHGIE